MKKIICFLLCLLALSNYSNALAFSDLPAFEVLHPELSAALVTHRSAPWVSAIHSSPHPPDKSLCVRSGRCSPCPACGR